MKTPNMKAPCANCPFKKTSLKDWIGRARMSQILSTDSFTCHKDRDKQCAGHMLVLGNDSAYVRLASAMKISLGLKGKDEVFKTKEECIEHHTKHR